MVDVIKQQKALQKAGNTVIFHSQISKAKSHCVIDTGKSDKNL